MERAFSAVTLPDPAPGWGNAQVTLAFLGRNLLKDFYGLLFLRRKGQLLPSAVMININGLEYEMETCSPLGRPH